MKRFLLGLIVSWPLVSPGQCVVTEDRQKRVVTICETYVPPSGLLINRPDRKQVLAQTTYLGSEYLTYPVWQNGSLELANHRNSIPCRIAFNLMTRQVLCQFEGDSVVRVVMPDAFTINGMHFVSLPENKTERIYYRVLYAGKTRLLAQYKCSIRRVSNEPYAAEQAFDGTYFTQKSFYLQRDNQRLRRIGLSRKSLINALDVAPGTLPAYLTKKKMNVHDLVAAVAYYDGFQ
ncbi:hypothetical protein ACFPMF_01000 [Larkinella bovis]|uniref:Helix-turn-helix domain-containing protein n=1 Tax=Larkinella bovis TaxID=683041 RepID=A0ABW0I643_9BACT